MSIDKQMSANPASTIILFYSIQNIIQSITKFKENIMEKKKSLTITMFAVCAALIIGLVAAVAVLAANAQSFKSNINVSFVAQDIAGTVKATFTDNGTAKAMKVGGLESGADTLTFDADTTTLQTLSPTIENVALSKTHPVVFVYTFTNSGDRDYTASLTANITSNNVNVEYKAGETVTESLQITVPASGSATFTVTVTLDNEAKDASYVGDFSWNLSAVQSATTD